ncbi:RNA polymerase sigma factor [Amycolatopsis thermoflava]|uniref:RNA polymerase sigma factor n=1 Tax=Amycolatopsis thermoflava TaxID=84480 RepID=UPI00364718A5
MPPLDDVLQQARSGNPAAFAAIYKQHASSIFRYLRIRLANTATAEDFTSETFLRAWRKLPDFRPELGSFTGWLYTIANNLVRDHRKSSGYRCELLDGEHHDRPDPAQEVDLLALSRIEAGALRRYLGELSDLQRECLLLRFFAGLSVAEVATMMNKNTNSIRALQHRATRSLARLMAHELAACDMPLNIA